MLDGNEEKLEAIVDDEALRTPLLQILWALMPAGARGIVASEPLIPKLAMRAKAIAEEHPEFIRGDQGQVVGVFPEREVYYGPSAGLAELRTLVARFWTLAYGLDGRPGIPAGGLTADHVAIVSGATEGLAIVLRLVSFDQVIGLTRLHWGNYRGIIGNAGGRSVVVDLFDDQHRLALERAEETIRRHRVRALLLNFPTNPSGDVLLDDEWSALAEMARRQDILLIADEVYNWIRYDDRPQSLLAVAPERSIVVSSASKEYLIPGARTGYVISANAALGGKWMPKLIRATSSSPNVLGQQQLLGMIASDVADLERGDPPGILGEIKAELRRRRDRMTAVARSAGFTVEGRQAEVPVGGISLLARLPEDLAVDDEAFVDRAMEMKRFSAIPGTPFGAPGCVRFGYAGMTVEQIDRMEVSLREVADALRR